MVSVGLVECLVILRRCIIFANLFILVHDKDMLMVLLLLERLTVVGGLYRALLCADPDDVFLRCLSVLPCNLNRALRLAFTSNGDLGRANLRPKLILGRRYSFRDSC